MTPTPTPDSADDTQSQLESLNESVSRIQQTIRQLQNATVTGVGSTTPARTKSGITVPPVSAVSATVIGNGVAGETQLNVFWQDAPQPTGATIDHYNVYAINAFAGQTQPTLIGAAKQSPFVGAFQPSSNLSVTIVVQTVLSNGQSLRLGDCPTTAIMAVRPVKSLLNAFLGFLPQNPAYVVVNSAGVTNILTASSANGGVLLSIATNFGTNPITYSSSIGLRVTVDGSANTYVLTSAASAAYLAPWSMTTIPVDTAGTQRLKEMGVGFLTSCVIDITSSGGTMSNSLPVSVDYALKL